MAVIDRVRARIVGYDETTGEALIRAPANFIKMAHQQQREVWCEFIDARPLSSKQRRSCYAMIREIADWSGDTTSDTKDVLKLDFWCGELLEMADTMFSLSNAPMSIVAAFQSWLAKFIVRNDVPTKRPMLEYVDDIDDYVYACLIAKKCPICGKKADLHHWDALGMGRNRDEIIHEGLEVMPLCREHHMEVHTTGKADFVKKYHLNDHGIPADKTICKLYKLKVMKKYMLEWRNDPATDKQLAYIAEMQEYSDFPIPVFIGTTKGEASDYINRWTKVAHEKYDFDGHSDNYGDRM